MDRILVTGANGFIGSHLVRHLLALKKEENWKEDIVCLVRATSDLSSLKDLDVKLVIGDLRHPRTLVNAVQGATYIYHLGAVLYAISRKCFMETNTEGTQNLLEVADRYAKDSLKRFVFVSSQAAAGPAQDETPITEDDEPSKPVSWYAESKLEAERIAAQYASKIPLTVVRPCSVYGERDPGFLPSFKAAGMRIQGVTGFRKSYTGMIYGKDLVEGIVAAGRHPKSVGQTYFLANPENYTVRDMVKTMGKAVGKPLGLRLPVPLFLLRIAAIFSELLYLFTRKKPIPSRDKVRDLSQRFWLCSPQKALTDFGWQAKTPLRAGMEATYQFIVEEKRRQREMPEESKGILWLKYFLLALVLGAGIEALAAFGNVYAFIPRWLVVPIVFGLWGCVFGSIAMALRMRNFFVQYLPGFLILFWGEMLNNFYLHKWEFCNGSLYGITDPVIRAAVLGVATGFLIPIMNAIMTQFYKVRLRLG